MYGGFLGLELAEPAAVVAAPRLSAVLKPEKLGPAEGRLMRIVHVTKKYPRALGGDATVVERLRLEQIVAGHRAFVVTSRCSEIVDEPDVIQVGLIDTAERLDQVTPRRLLSLACLAVRAFRILGQVCPDVVHTHSLDMAAAVAPAARRYRVPIVHTCHDISAGNPHIASWKQSLERALFQVAKPAQVVAHSVADKERLGRAGVQAVTIPHGRPE
jgi:phosphatidyl-myo-inositol alpha-mannosyltransferase